MLLQLDLQRLDALVELPDLVVQACHLVMQGGHRLAQQTASEPSSAP